MASKIKCTCGHSWNKSDSSKKDMHTCHVCGKDNVMKNGGWLSKYEEGGVVQENYNDSDVSLPEGFVGMGNDTTGRNYSPAWGGQFQTGGTLPGAVGFTYARTAGSAPSEGKYAKKTLPSAQNGQEMKFYQEGLDWKPKSMQNGGVEKNWLGKAKQFISEEISDPLTMKGLSMLNDLKPLTNEQIYKTVRPTDYPNFFKLPGHAYNYLMGNESDPIVDQYGNPHISEEFYSTAMGLNNESKFLKESEYSPSTSKNPDANYYSIRDIIDQDKVFELTRNLKAGQKLPVNGLDQILKEEWLSEYGNSKVDEKDKSFKKFMDLDPLQRFTLQKSNDNSYVSMYDKYDFDNPAINRLLHPVEVYDRFYRDKPKSKLLPSSPSKKKEGGIVEDDNGYLNPDNQGKVVRVNSNLITMEGVDQELLGVSNTGDTKLMKPGKNYKFKGEKVTEYPIGKNGINQLDAQPKKKLDDLLNFTNYNKPASSGWLDKFN